MDSDGADGGVAAGHEHRIDAAAQAGRRLHFADVGADIIPPAPSPERLSRTSLHSSSSEQQQYTPSTDPGTDPGQDTYKPPADYTEDETDDDSVAEEFTALFAPRKHKFDIVDFRTPTSKANLASYYPRTPRDESANYRMLMILALITGLCVSAAGFAIEQGVRAVFWMIYTPTVSLLSRDTTSSFAAAAAVFIGLSTVSIALASCLVVFLSPLAAGSGIPEIKSYLNGVLVPGLVKIRTLIAKGVGVALSIGGGLVCGKEGPMIHCGGILGAAVSQMASPTFNFRSKWPALQYFRSDSWKRDFTAIGAAAGVAVAFSAPVGGVLFVIEEAATHWSQPLSWAAIVAAAVAALVGGTLSSFAHGHFNVELSYTGAFDGPGSEQGFHIIDVPFYALIGIAGGLLGGLLVKLQKPITLFRFKSISTPLRRLAEAVAIAILTASLRLAISGLAGSCQPISDSLAEAIPENISHFRASFTCPEGEYNNVAAIFFQPIEVTVRTVLHTSSPREFSPWLLFGGVVFFFLMTTITYGIGVPSGVFVPSFVIGSLLGRLVGVLVHIAWPGHDAFHIETFAFAGAVAGLAGITRMTMSVAMIAIETTSNGHAFTVALLVAIIAKFTGDALAVGIYDLHIQLKGVPYLEERIERADAYYSLKVRDVMSTGVVAVYAKMRIRNLVAILKSHSHGSFPVVRRHSHNPDRTCSGTTMKYRGDCNLSREASHRSAHTEELADNKSTAGLSCATETPPGIIDFNTHSLKGMIGRRMLLALLSHYDELPEQGFLPRKYYDSAWPNTRLLRSEQEILSSLKDEDMERVIDLCPYTDPNPETVTESATAAEARNMFRSSGARHALVVHIKSGTVVGILTRKDILESAVEEVHHQHTS